VSQTLRLTDGLFAAGLWPAPSFAAVPLGGCTITLPAPCATGAAVPAAVGATLAPSTSKGSVAAATAKGPPARSGSPTGEGGGWLGFSLHVAAKALWWRHTSTSLFLPLSPLRFYAATSGTAMPDLTVDGGRAAEEARSLGAAGIAIGKALLHSPTLSPAGGPTGMATTEGGGGGGRSAKEGSSEDGEREDSDDDVAGSPGGECGTAGPRERLTTAGDVAGRVLRDGGGRKG